MEPGAKGVEGGRAAEGPEVHVIGKATSGQCGAGGTRQPGRAVRMSVPGGAEGAPQS